MTRNNREIVDVLRGGCIMLLAFLACGFAVGAMFGAAYMGFRLVVWWVP